MQIEAFESWLDKNPLAWLLMKSSAPVGNQHASGGCKGDDVTMKFEIEILVLRLLKDFYGN